MSEIGAVADYFSEIEDPEGRHEITTDSEDKIISYRKEDGTLVENVGIESPKITTNSFNLSESGMTEFQHALKESGFNPGGGSGDWTNYLSKDGEKPLNIPKPRCAMVNIISDFNLSDLSKVGRPGAQQTVNYDIPTEVEFWDMQGNYFKKWTLMSGQGRGTMAYVKKNIALDFFDDGVYDSKGRLGKGDALSIKFGEWVAQDSFHLKAGYEDGLRCKGVVTYHLWDEMLKTYGYLSDYNWKRAIIKESELNPVDTGCTKVSDLLNAFDDGPKCFPDGFPCVVYQNGKFWGLYVFQLKKHRDVYRMDKSEAKHVHLDGVLNNAFWTANGNPSAIDWDCTNMWSGIEVRNPKDLYCINTEPLSGLAYTDITGTEEAASVLASGNYTEVTEKPSDWTDADIHAKFGDNPPAYCYRTSKSKMYKLEEVSGEAYTKYDGDTNAAELIDASMPYYISSNKDHVRTDAVKTNILNLTKVIPALGTLEQAYNSDRTAENLQAIKDYFEAYFDVNNLIDYLIFSDVTYNWDGFGANWQWTTWDGVKWFVNLYDTNQTFGNMVNGPDLKPPISGHVRDTLMMHYIISYYSTELEDRYKYLRDAGIIEVNHIVRLFTKWMEAFGKPYYALEYAKWNSMFIYDTLNRLYIWTKQEISNMDILYHYQ